MKDKRTFGMPVIALSMAIVSIVTIQEGDAPFVTLVHVLFAGLCIVMGFMGLSFALRWNEEWKPPPIARPSTTAAAGAAAAATSGSAGTTPDDHLPSTFGTSGVGSEMSAGQLSPGTMCGGSSGDCSTDSSGDSGGDSAGYDSGGGGGWN